MSGSFFGLGGPADDPIARERAAFRASMPGASALDTRLESMALNDGLRDQLDEVHDTFNDETFDADSRVITGGDFDFFQSTTAGQGRMAPQQQQAAGAPRKVMTLAELEAQLIPQRHTPAPAPAPVARAPEVAWPPKLARADPETIAARRAERLQRQAALTKYDNLMSQRDKDFIIRIQVSQLLTDDPAADDFYCHMFQLSRGAVPAAGATQQRDGAGDGAGGDASSAVRALQEALAQRGVQAPVGGEPEQLGAGAQRDQHFGRARRSNTQSSMARMQQQVQRFVNEARRRPKIPHVALEGALGKISVNSARNPKQVIQVQRGHSSSVSHPAHDAKQQSPSAYDLGGVFSGLGDARSPAAERRKTLRAVENVYTAVLRLEQLIREHSRLPSSADHPSVQNWVRAYSEARDWAWAELGAAQPIMNVYPHPLVRFLAFSKGKRVIPRLAHHLSIDQVLALTTTIIANFESLDVCRFGSFGQSAESSISTRQREETELFLHAALPPALSFLSEASVQLVNGLLALFMERNNVAWVARTRPALVFLTVVLGRTAALKQAGALGAGDDPQALYQATELYNHLFGTLQGGLSSVFPPAALSQAGDPLEDAYAWQFLATLALGASVEQQHALVTEVRDKVLEAIQLAKSGRFPADVAAAITANINLFLNTLGLDASQVTM
ncbi:DNA topoisomerase 2-associated protein pat1 [Coemansia biformis]|uniref:DNA topoisomerase 2-associated protein pat1 n=1 Tax=Coemansia biformis TaxID=1286918 RepID=A0A9W7Y8Q6_9FUNG|nr:DNA topoisomerase 2-associated protein pat1 [Coemansia biformis]